MNAKRTFLATLSAALVSVEPGDGRDRGLPGVGQGALDAVEPDALRVGGALDVRVDEQLAGQGQDGSLELAVIEEVRPIHGDTAHGGSGVVDEADHEGARIRLAGLGL